MLRDLDIRRALRALLAEGHAGEPGARVVDELGIRQGSARVDLAVINGSINGFEIKSDADRLDRLGRQRDAYGTVLDTVTLVGPRPAGPWPRRAAAGSGGRGPGRAQPPSR